MNSPAVFGIYTARFPFVDKPAAKTRPVIVISHAHSEHRLIVVIPITSTDKREPIDIVINDWKDSGLLRPSVARIHRIATLPESELHSYLGSISKADETNLKTALKDLLQLP